MIGILREYIGNMLDILLKYIGNRVVIYCKYIDNTLVIYWSRAGLLCNKLAIRHTATTNLSQNLWEIAPSATLCVILTQYRECTAEVKL